MTTTTVHNATHVHVDGTAIALLQEWHTWWEANDEAPAKMPEALHVRTALALREFERFGHGDVDRTVEAIREALADLWSSISQPDISALAPETIMLAQGNHRLLGRKERSERGSTSQGRAPGT